MSKKFLVGILDVAIEVVATALGTLVGGPGIGTAIGALVGAGIAAGVNSPLLKAPKPKVTETSLKSPTPPRVSAYGECRLYGAYILYVTDANGRAIDVWAFHDGRIDRVVQYFIGDKRVLVKSNSGVQGLEDGTFGDNSGPDLVFMGSTLGANPNTAFSAIISAVPDQWSTTHRGDGVVTGYMISTPVKTKNWSTVYSTGGPNATPMSIAAHWQLVFDWRDETQSVDDQTTWKWSANAVLHLAHYLLVRMNRTWSLHFEPTLSYWTTAANDADVLMDLTQVQTILTFTRHQGDKYVQVYDVNGLSVGMTINIYVSGDNTYTEQRVVTSIDGGTINFSNGLAYKHPQGSQVTWVSNPDTPVTESRYRSCVSHQHTDAHKDVLAHLLACFDGYLTPRSDGALVVYSGRYTAPTVSIGPDQIIDFDITDGTNQEDQINTIKVTYISANHDYNTVDTDDWTDEDAISADGEILSDPLENQVPSYSQARRLAKRAMVKLNAPYKGTCRVNAAGRTVIGQRYINLTIIEAGSTFYDGPVELGKVTRELKTGGVSFEWFAADPDIDSWNPATEEGNPAPVGNRVAPDPLATPVIDAASASLSDNSAAGTPGVRLSLTVEGLDRDDVTWYARTRTQGAAVWDGAEYSDIDAGSSVVLVTNFVATDAMVEAEVAYGTGDGRLSAYSDTVTVDTSTAALAPSAPTNFTATGGTGTYSATWTNPASANFSRSRVYVGSDSTFSHATAVTPDIAGSRSAISSYSPTGITAGTYYLWVEAISTAGVASAPAGPVNVTVT